MKRRLGVPVALEPEMTAAEKRDRLRQERDFLEEFRKPGSVGRRLKEIDAAIQRLYEAEP